MRVGIITWPKWITHKKCHVFFYIVYFSLLYFLQVTTLARDVVSQEINVFSFFFFFVIVLKEKGQKVMKTIQEVLAEIRNII